MKEQIMFERIKHRGLRSLIGTRPEQRAVPKPKETDLADAVSKIDNTERE